ncbi:MAG: InlB B-repeat-containing protein, partial [Bacilli bacterium]|nr:InlB B-repeat-containing protein [Bacilli bacterium]
KHYNSVSEGVTADSWNGWTLTRESDTAVLFLVKDLVSISVSSNTTYSDAEFAAIWAAQDVLYKSCGNVILNTSTSDTSNITFNFNNTAFNGETMTNEIAVKIDVDGEILAVYSVDQIGITLAKGQALYVTKYLDRQLGLGTGFTVGTNFSLEQIRDFVQKYVVTFNVDGSTNDVEVFSNYAVTQPSNPTKSGYTFVEWRLNGVAYNFSTPVTSNITLVAYFVEAVTYDVTFNVDGSTSITAVTEGETVTQPSDPVKSGYTFVEWRLDGIAYNFSTPVTANITLIAYFTENVFSITYNVNGGSWTKETLLDDFLTDLYTYVSPSESLSDFMHGVGNTSGYAGLWRSNATYNAKIYDGPRPNAPDDSKNYFIYRTEYYSKWIAFFDMIDVLIKEVNVAQFFFGAGTYTGLLRLYQYATEDPIFSTAQLSQIPATYIPGPATYNDTTPTITLPIPVKSGSIFGGWYDNDVFSGSAITTIPNGSTGNKVFYAKWDAVVDYSITYTLNGGINDGNNPTTYNLLSLPLYLYPATRSARTFQGWYYDTGFTNRVGTGTTDSALGGTTNDTIPVGKTGNITVYAYFVK